MGLRYRVKYPKRYGIATQSGTPEFPNLLVEKKVDGINQIWQGDKAHYLYGDTKLYTICLTDVCSQEIVCYGAYDSNQADNYKEVKQRVVKRERSKGQKIKGIIHHSDGGKQYESGTYKSL